MAKSSDQQVNEEAKLTGLRKGAPHTTHYRVLEFVLRIIYKVLIRVTVRNVERVPANGPVLLVANHESLRDMFMIEYKMERYPKWMAKSSLFKFKPMGWMISKFGAFPTKRDGHDIGSLRVVDQYLDDGEVVGMFPQGTRTRGRRDSLPFKPGFVKLAYDHGAIIQPIAIWGKSRPFGYVNVEFLEPVDPRSLLGKGETLDKIAERRIALEIQNRIYDVIPRDANGPRKK